MGSLHVRRWLKRDIEWLQFVRQRLKHFFFGGGGADGVADGAGSALGHEHRESRCPAL